LLRVRLTCAITLDADSTVAGGASLARSKTIIRSSHGMLFFSGSSPVVALAALPFFPTREKSCCGSDTAAAARCAQLVPRGGGAVFVLAVGTWTRCWGCTCWRCCWFCRCLIRL
jgi:hypothetical protein